MDAANARGLTALMRAALGGHTECVRLLVAGGADCTLKATGGRWSGWTALGIADKNGHGDSMAAILRQPWGGRRADAAGSAPEPELDWREPLADQVQSRDALIAAAAEFLADPLTASAPLEQKSRYLQKKHGLTQAGVDLLCELEGLRTSQ